MISSHFWITLCTGLVGIVLIDDVCTVITWVDGAEFGTYDLEIIAIDV